jgi:hypothetical protein
MKIDRELEPVHPYSRSPPMVTQALTPISQIKPTIIDNIDLMDVLSKPDIDVIPDAKSIVRLVVRTAHSIINQNDEKLTQEAASPFSQAKMFEQFKVKRKESSV